MFKRLKEDDLLRQPKSINSGNLHKLRILDSIPLKKLNDSQSLHSSIMTQSRHSSIKNIHNPSIMSSEFSMRSSLIQSRSTDKKKKPFMTMTKEQAIQNLFERYYQLPFIKSLVQYLTKEWTVKEKQLLLDKKIQNFVQSVIQRSNWIKDLVEEFVEKQYTAFSGEDGHILMSLLFKQTIHSIKDLEGVIPEIIKKIPDQRIFKQEMIIEQLQTKIAEIYDPKCLYSNLKIKERMALYLSQFTTKKNDLKADLCTKLISSLSFLESMEEYLSTYQKEIIKLKSQISALQNQKTRFQVLLDKKSSFTPLSVDYEMLYKMKETTNKQIKEDLEQHIVTYHQEKHKKNEGTIAMLEEREHSLREENDQLKEEIIRLKDQINSLQKKMPQHREVGVQVYLINQGKGSEGIGGVTGSLLTRFLDNVVTPFSFSSDIAASLISVLAIDKILFDYQSIRMKESLRSFEQFLFEWFIIRTGCRKIARIFVKNFFYSLKELRTSHKRFSIFFRVCGHSGYKRRNMQQDLEGIFFSTHLCWYYLVKLSLMYRRKLNQNPNGYQLLPPLPCEDIFKLPLRKIYELIQQFMRSQQMQVPPDLTQLIDHYCINEISKFKASDQSFQKQTLEEIHILRDINFDLIAGFIIEYIGHQRCEVLEKLLRTIDTKQKQEGNVLGYSEFQIIYKRYYKERKARIEQIYAKLCMVNQHDMLDIQNLHPVVYMILEDQTPLRTSFQKLQPLKALILSQKATILKTEKKPSNINSYQNFRERYYHQFYDFYNTTAFLQEIFKIIKVLVKKRLKGIMIEDEEIDKLVDYEVQIGKKEQKKIESNRIEGSSSDEEDAEIEEEVKVDPASQKKAERVENERKDMLVQKLEEWGKIITRVPHFATKVLTIDQIIIHNMRRKQMIEATQYAWKTLREILTILGKQ